MKKFLGYELVKLVKAIGNNPSAHDIVYSYEVEHYNGFGVKTTKIMKTHELDNRFGKLRMNKFRYGILRSGSFDMLDEDQFNNYLSKYEVAA